MLTSFQIEFTFIIPTSICQINQLENVIIICLLLDENKFERGSCAVLLRTLGNKWVR